MMQFHFNPDLPIRARSTSDAQASAAWGKHGLYTLHLFKHSNVLYQYDPWYRQLVEQSCGIADVQKYWENTQEASPQEASPPKTIMARDVTTGEFRPIQIQHILMSVSSKIYPAIAALLPVDEAARGVFASLGCTCS